MAKKLLPKLILLAIAIVLPLFLTSTLEQHIMFLIVIWSIAGIGWNFIGGYAGQVSIGHALFFAIGIYTPAALFDLFGIVPWFSLVLGVILSVICAALIGVPLLRLRGPQFSIATMAVVECMRTILINAKVIGGSAGIDFLNKKVNPYLFMQFREKREYYWVALAFLVLALFIAQKVDKSKFGYYLRSIAGNEMAAESVGINTAKYKSLAFMLSAAFVSVAGSLYAQYLLYIDPYVSSTMSVSLMIVLVVVMGGTGTVYGSIIGATVLVMISQYTRIYFGGTGTGIDLILYGALVIIVVLFLPHGVLPLLKTAVYRLGAMFKKGAGARVKLPEAAEPAKAEPAK